MPDKLTIKFGQTTKLSVRHLRVPSCQPERHHLRATGGLQRGQSDDDAQRLRSQPQPARRYADFVGDSESERNRRRTTSTATASSAVRLVVPATSRCRRSPTAMPAATIRASQRTDTGGWFMADFSHAVRPPVRGNAGARYVETRCQRLAIRAPVAAPCDGGQANLQRLPAVGQHCDGRYPRLCRSPGWAKVMSRPPLGSVSPGGSISTTGVVDLDRQPVVETISRHTLCELQWYWQELDRELGCSEEHQHLHPEPARQRCRTMNRLAAFMLPANFTGEEGSRSPRR